MRSNTSGRPIDAGLRVDEFAPRLSFFFAAHNNLFEEVAKFRAARRIWARIMKEKFGGPEKAQMLRFHTQTGGVTLTAQQPLNNVVRVALQALAAVLGGTQSLHTNSMDEALALPTEESVRLALRTQQVIAYESGVADTVDPLAGSYYVEALTREIEKEVWGYLDKIDEMGGMLAAIETGYVQKQIQESAYAFQREMDSRRAGHRRRQPLPGRKSRGSPADAQGLPRVGGAAERAAGPGEARKGFPEGLGGAGRGQGRGRGREKPDAADPRRRQGSTPPCRRSPTSCAPCSASTRKGRHLSLGDRPPQGLSLRRPAR